MRCSVKSANERNPRRVLQVSRETAGFKPEEGEDDVKSAWPLYPGLHTRYNGWYNWSRNREVEPILKASLSSDCRLQLACMKMELLVNAGQQHCVEYVPGDCTHRPSRHGSWQYLKSVSQPAREGAAEGRVGNWDEVVTR